jgi:type IV pilus assembly protein PilA
MKRIQKGFTLIELMIVVAIIGILAAVAIPQYQDYTVKAKLSKVQSTLAPVKTALALFFQEQGGFPTAASAWTSLGIASTGPSIPNELSGITVAASTGAITATINNVKASDIDTTTLILTPSTVTGQTAMTWAPTCTSTNAVLKKYFSC